MASCVEVCIWVLITQQPLANYAAAWRSDIINNSIGLLRYQCVLDIGNSHIMRQRLQWLCLQISFQCEVNFFLFCSHLLPH